MFLKSKELFAEKFGYQPSETYFSPGRVNLIGEYTDIAGGHVLPMTIQLGIEASVSKRKDRIIRVFSLNDIREFSLDSLVKTEISWINFVIGEFVIFRAHDIETDCGLDIALDTSLPQGSGLSSSACLEVLIGTIINNHSNKEVSKFDIVSYSKENENKFIGLSSGIMDQFACEFGEKNMCIALDTKSLEYKMIPFDLKENDLIIMNSNKHRELKDSKYNLRVQEMKDGLKDLAPYLKFKDACDISFEDLEKYKDKITSHDSYLRLKHLITDNERVLKCGELLSDGKIDEFAHLLDIGHQSVSKDFEVAGKELDALVRLAKEKGAKGARMTGAGFGGCAIFISSKDKTEDIISYVKENYYKEIGLKCDCYYAVPTDGARRIK